MKLLPLAVLLLLLATPGYAQQDPSIDCIKALPADARFAPINAKLAVGMTADTTFPMLADETLASDDEREAISAWATARNDCMKSGEDFRRRNYPPQINAVVLEAQSALLSLGADLFNRKLTYAEFNRRRQTAGNELRNKLAAIAQQLKSEQEAQQQANQRTQAAIDEQQRQQADAARRQILMQMIQNNRPVQIQPYQVPIPQRPTNTNCQWILNQMHCTTQ